MNQLIDTTMIHLDSGRLDQLGSLGWTVVALLTGYLGLIILLNLWARRSRSNRVHRVTVALTPRIIGMILTGLLATAGPVAAQTNSTVTPSLAGPASATGSSGSSPVMEVFEAPSGTVGSIPTMTTTRQSPTTQAPVDGRPSTPDEQRSSQSPPSEIDQSRGSATAPTGKEREPDPARTNGTVSEPRVHVVEPGEYFWSIAEAVFTSSGIDHPDEMELSRYWLSLIDANRARLVDPGNPDLIMPGQNLVLPPLD